MIIDTQKDPDFIALIDFLFSFDFDCKDIIKKQLQTAIVKKEKSDYHIAFRFYVDTFQEPLPASFCGQPPAVFGIPVAIEVKNGEDHTCCELFVGHQYIIEYRLYNINATALNMENFWKGTARFIYDPPNRTPGDS